MNVTELIEAIPAPREEDSERRSTGQRTSTTRRAIPTGRWRRLSLLASLHAKISAGYLFQWCRSWFQSESDRKKAQAESNWVRAAQVLDSMSYLRGAFMKVGQTMANHPLIVSREFVETLDGLHFDAPPLHWALIEEMVENELGRAPEELFEQFDRHAIAAASLGQVHLAQLSTGEDVAVKIQYPGIAATIQDDVRNLQWLLLPSRLSKDWDSVQQQLEDTRIRLGSEVNYLLEASTLDRVRPLFDPSEGIRIPRVYPHLCTERVLTMEYLPGRPLTEFLASQPSQAQRNAVARKVVRAFYRMWCAGRLAYVDFHPGNLLVTDDGEIGLIDFGMMLPLDDQLWDYYRRHDRAFSTGEPDLLAAANAEWCGFQAEELTSEQAKLTLQFMEWQCQPRFQAGEFDFSDEANFRQGIELFLQLIRQRSIRAHACTPVSLRLHLGLRALLYRLQAQVDVAVIANEEVVATQWDRSTYHPPPIQSGACS
jgi:predicted unusual protein kinase regulating ubiquinone biosynthesis (AarF/ABC1/UbiB family)